MSEYFSGGFSGGGGGCAASSMSFSRSAFFFAIRCFSNVCALGLRLPSLSKVNTCEGFEISVSMSGGLSLVNSLPSRMTTCLSLVGSCFAAGLMQKP